MGKISKGAGYTLAAGFIVAVGLAVVQPWEPQIEDTAPISETNEAETYVPLDNADPLEPSTEPEALPELEEGQPEVDQSVVPTFEEQQAPAIEPAEEAPTFDEFAPN